MNFFVELDGKKFYVIKEVVNSSCRGCHFFTGDCGLSTNDFGFDTDSCYRNGTILSEVTEPKIQQEASVWPPISITPLVNHNTTRLNALMDTLQRYAEAGSAAKVQWVQEVKSLIEYERSLTREALDKVPFKL